MAHSTTCPALSGARELEHWFGEWPSFHDAEVIEVRLSVEEASLIRLRTWKMSKEIDSRGHYVRTQQVVVSFELHGVFGLELFEFGHQNVLNGLFVDKVDGGHRIELEQLHGVGGWILAREVVVSFAPELE